MMDYFTFPCHISFWSWLKNASGLCILDDFDCSIGGQEVVKAIQMIKAWVLRSQLICQHGLILCVTYIDL